MNKNIFFVSVLFCAVFITFVDASQKLFKVLKPLNLSTYNEDYASIVIKRLDRSLKKVTISVNSKKRVVVLTDKKRNIYCKTIKLDIGDNKVKLTGQTKKGRSTRTELNLFYRSELYKGTIEAPDNYKRNFFHTNKNENLCKSCHNMNKDKTSKLKKRISASKINAKEFKVIKDPKKSNCYTCHKTITFKKNGHTPAVNFLCTECHTGKSAKLNADDKGKSKYLMEDPTMNKCFSCHEGVKKDWLSVTSQHDTLKEGRCNKCHNPHASNFEFHLRKPIRELCLTCHVKKASGRHVLGSFVFGRNKGSHPTKGKKDPSRPGRDLVCSSCHNPHGSNGIYLLRAEGKTPYSVCVRCHKK